MYKHLKPIDLETTITIKLAYIITQTIHYIEKKTSKRKRIMSSTLSLMFDKFWIITFSTS